MTEVSSDKTSNHVIPVSSTEDKIFALKFDRNHATGTGVTSLFSFDPKTRIEKTVITKNANYNTKSGEAMLAFDCYDDKIYILTDTGVNGVTKQSIGVYDNKFKQIDTIHIDNFNERFLRQVNKKFQRLGDYIFISNISDYGILGKIVDNKIQIILEGKNLDISASFAQNGRYVFYKRDTNDYVVFDSNSGKLVEKTFILEKGKQIIYSFSDDKDLVMVLGSVESQKKSVYRLDLAKFIDSALKS